jgi:secreted trypsin-like serine protease
MNHQNLISQPSTPLQGHPNVRPIALPSNCDTACCGVCVAGPDITVAGWGLNDNQQIPENLLQVQKAIFNQAECNRIWGGDITSRMFCTLVVNGMDSCNGDSGSAITRAGVQVGVVSFGSEVCGDGSAPAVYVRLEDPKIRNFIRVTTGV